MPLPSDTIPCPPPSFDDEPVTAIRAHHLHVRRLHRRARRSIDALKAAADQLLAAVEARGAR